jgi:hypothetical protein
MLLSSTKFYDNAGTDVGEGVEIMELLERICRMGIIRKELSLIPTGTLSGIIPKIQWFWNRFRINKWFCKMVLLMVLH